MVIKVFSIYDGKSKAFGLPFFMQTQGMALRGFSDLVNDTSTLPGKHPGDFNLYLIAEYDDADGTFSAINPCLLLGNGLEYSKFGKVVEEEKKEVEVV